MSEYNIYSISVYADIAPDGSKVTWVDVYKTGRTRQLNPRDARSYSSPRAFVRAQLMQRRLMGIKDD